MIMIMIMIVIMIMTMTMIMIMIMIMTMTMIMIMIMILGMQAVTSVARSCSSMHNLALRPYVGFANWPPRQSVQQLTYNLSSNGIRVKEYLT